MDTLAIILSLILVGGTLAIGQHLHASRREHLHHEARARARQPRDNRDEVG